MKNKNVSSIIKTARIAGFLYLLQIPLGIFGVLYVEKLITVKGNIEETVKNILDNEFLFRMSIVSAILVALVTVLTASQLYKVFSSVNKLQAKLMVIFTAISAPITILNELNNVAVLLIAQSSQHESLSLFLKLHQYGLHLSGLFWGLWLLPMSYLVIKSNYIPKIIGVFLVIGSFGYVTDFLIYFINVDTNIVIGQFTFIGEVLMVFWLLIKGIKRNKFKTTFEN